MSLRAMTFLLSVLFLIWCYGGALVVENESTPSDRRIRDVSIAVVFRNLSFSENIKSVHQHAQTSQAVHFSDRIT